MKCEVSSSTGGSHQAVDKSSEMFKVGRANSNMKNPGIAAFTNRIPRNTFC